MKQLVEVKADIQPFARAAERRIVHALMLGALDSAREIDLDSMEDEKPLLASKILLADNDKPPDFSKMRFHEAERFFRKLNVVTRSEFDNLLAAARRRAFTVAGIFDRQLLTVLQGELANQIGKGADIREFRKIAEARLKSSGFIASQQVLENGQRVMSASHVEVVFRTNVLNGYNAGRAAQQSDPIVMRARPVREIRAIRDRRTRTAHLRAHGTKLLATDSFWERAYPPFGYNCRCRVVSRPRAEMDQVVSGSTISGLPDRGFTSGISTLL